MLLAQVIKQLPFIRRRQRSVWGERFDTEPPGDVLDAMSEMAPRDMRRAWMTAFGNAKLDRRERIATRDLPDGRSKRSAIGFMQ